MAEDGDDVNEALGWQEGKVYKLVLTGGPCGGKTTGQARLTSFFESLGWKVYRVPETATILMGGGVKFASLTKEEAYKFQENLILTMIQVEKSLFDLASSTSGTKPHVMYICDRGLMDATAFMAAEEWERMKKENDWHEVDLRDNRYDHVIHMVSASVGAEQFYTTHDHVVRSENLEEARMRDKLAEKAWTGHPSFNCIDNSTNFEQKIQRLIQCVCDRLGISISNWPSATTIKRKYIISSWPEPTDIPLEFQEFECIHNYLVTPSSSYQARIRRRGQNKHWTYTHTVRRPNVQKERIELKRNITGREYQSLLAQRDRSRATVYMKRRCFVWNHQYFKLDLYLKPCPAKCHELVILSTHTEAENAVKLPTFLKVKQEVTESSVYSMYNLAHINHDDNKMVNGVISEEFRDKRRVDRMESVSDIM